MEKVREEKILRYVFDISILIKAFDGIVELIGGTMLYFFNLDAIKNLAIFLTRHELAQDPNDLIANLLIHSAQNLSIDFKLFLVAYLLSHGLIKIFIVANIFRNKLWAYPLAIVTFTIFVIYQIYHLSFDFSIMLLLLTIFDIFVIWLTWHEFKQLQIKILNEKNKF